MTSPIRFVFLELTNRCNFSCTFCPDGVMRRPRQFMDRDLALRLLGEIADKCLASEPIQLHVMGEPFLHPHLFEILAFMRDRNLQVRLFTNGALLHTANRECLFRADIDELVIGIQTPSEGTYRDHRRGRPDYETYMRQIHDTIRGKFESGARTRIELHYMNTKHFNEFRGGKGYHRTMLPLVDDNAKALAIIDEWKRFGRKVSRDFGLGHEPVDLEGLQGPYRDDPLACVRGNHCEFLPGVILGFKEIGTFCDYLVNPIRFVERYTSDCRALNEQLAVLANGECTLCCVDYDGRMAVGHAGTRSLEEIWASPAVQGLQRANDAGLLPTPLCRVCRAFQVVDDYSRKFPSREQEPFELERGWYPLEQDGEQRYRWIGKRAVLTLLDECAAIEFLVQAGHPRLDSMAVSVSQGNRRRRWTLAAGTWHSVRFETGPVDADGRQVILESEEFWIPAAVIASSGDRRELSVRVSDVNIVPAARGRLRDAIRSILLPRQPRPSRPSTPR